MDARINGISLRMRVPSIHVLFLFIFTDKKRRLDLRLRMVNALNFIHQPGRIAAADW